MLSGVPRLSRFFSVPQNICSFASDFRSDASKTGVLLSMIHNNDNKKTEKKMTPFIIFVLVLTFGYLIYFTVMITLDLHGKKDERKVEEENIDVSEFAEESPVVVDESDDSQGGALTYTEEVDDDGLRVVTPSGNMDSAVSYEENENTQSEQEPEPKTTSEELNEENELYMEQIDPKAQLSIVSDTFINNLNEKQKQRKIERKNAIDHL